VANLTITVDDQVLRRARVRAAEEGTSVNAVLRRELERYVGEDRAIAEAWDTFLRLTENLKVSSPAGGRTWTRGSIQRYPE
jgi:plasmid stability protein